MVGWSGRELQATVQELWRVREVMVQEALLSERLLPSAQASNPAPSAEVGLEEMEEGGVSHKGC